MAEVMGVAVAGVAGRMGQMLARAVAEAPELALVGATVRPGHAWEGVDLAEPLGPGMAGVRATADPLEAFRTAAAILDFTTPALTGQTAVIAAQARAVHVIGTTGFSEAEIAALAPAARHSVQIRAGNMSLGVNVLTVLARQVAAALDPSYDIEIVEMHHRHKADAPSGTALMLGEAAAAGRGIPLTEVAERGRDGLTGPRAAGRIGFAALRGGDVAGEHDVIFAAEGERVVLRHIATDRMIFARGAVKAALWGRSRAPGAYTMLDVLGLARP